MQNKKAMSPLIATVFLVVFALIIGTVTMGWSKDYVKNLPPEEIKKQNDISFKSSIVIDINEINDPLKDLQIKYITGKISLDEYLQQETPIVENMKNS
jgi:hypothetical protein